MRVRDVCRILIIASLMTPPLRAQEPVTLRYAPRVGALVRTITRSEGTIVLRALDATAQPVGDSAMGEMRSWAGITRRVLEGTDTTRVVEVSYDSLKTQTRLTGQPWKEVALAQADKVALSVTLNDQLHPIAGGNGGLAADPVANGGIASWRGVGLPGHPVSPGALWVVQTSYHLPTQLGDLLDVSVRDSIIANATVRLDSVMPQVRDTLVYLTVRETLGPITLPATDAGAAATVELAGSQAATLVWSTAWNAFVSGASQARVIGRLRSVSADGTARASQITWNVSTSLQVRL
jgi:hypothetical protein